MNEQANGFAKKRIVQDVHDDSIRVRRGLEIPAGTETLSIDVYEPARSSGAAVMIVCGYPARGLQSFLGCRYNEMGWTVSWAELMASSGITAVTYSAADPLNVHKLLQQIGDGAIGGIDAGRLGILASSGNGPMALALLRRDAAVAIRCAALLYAYTIDIEESTAVADGAKNFRFANPGTAAAELRQDVPLFVARAGRDETPGLNDALDAFIGDGLRRNVPLSFINHATAPHAFDLFDDSEATRAVIGRAVGFFIDNL